jgi:hypothetical protein
MQQSNREVGGGFRYLRASNLKWITMNSPHDGAPHEEFDNKQIIVVPCESLTQIFKASQR